jgi:hypothetical protein
MWGAAVAGMHGHENPTSSNYTLEKEHIQLPMLAIAQIHRAESSIIGRRAVPLRGDKVRHATFTFAVPTRGNAG